MIFAILYIAALMSIIVAIVASPAHQIAGYPAAVCFYLLGASGLMLAVRAL